MEIAKSIENSCVCGVTEASLWSTIDGIAVVMCNLCGIRRIAVPEDRAYFVRDSPLVETARALAGTGASVLTVGSTPELYESLVSAGFNAFAVSFDDFNHIHLREMGIIRRSLDVVIMDESIVKIGDPAHVLETVAGLLKRDGIILARLPDMDSQAAKSAGLAFEYLNPRKYNWYFTSGQVQSLFRASGLSVISVESDNTGMIVVSGMPTTEVTDVTIFGPPGVGDILWTLNKLADIRQREAPCRVKYVVCVPTGNQSIAERGKDLLSLCPLVDSCDFQDLPLPADVGNINPKVAMYNLIANDFLEPNKPGKKGGSRIEEWRTEFKTDHNLGINVPDSARLHAKRLLNGADPYVAVYFSSVAWNDACLDSQAWFASDWARVCIKLNDDAGLKPVVLGKGWDKDYISRVTYAMRALDRDPDEVWINLLGMTTLPSAMAVMEGAKCTVGICAGLPMLAAYFGWPTVIMWPLVGSLKRPVAMNFYKEFQTNWVPPSVLKSGSYVPISFGKFNADSLIDILTGKARAAIS